MPFNSSYQDGENFSPLDSRDYLMDIARRIVREPLSTYIVPCKDQDGRTRFLVIERGLPCGEGSLVVVSGRNGLTVGTLKSDDFPAERIWGKITWYLQSTR